MGTLPECGYSFHQLWVRKTAVGNILKANKYVFFEQHHSDVQHWRKTKMTVCHLCALWPLQVTENRSNGQTSTAFLPVLKGWVAFQKSLIYSAFVFLETCSESHSSEFMFLRTPPSCLCWSQVMLERNSSGLMLVFSLLQEFLMQESGLPCIPGTHTTGITVCKHSLLLFLFGLLPDTFIVLLKFN